MTARRCEMPAAGMPKTLKFVDGKLEDFAASGSAGLDLDD